MWHHQRLQAPAALTPHPEWLSPRTVSWNVSFVRVVHHSYRKRNWNDTPFGSPFCSVYFPWKSVHILASDTSLCGWPVNFHWQKGLACAIPHTLPSSRKWPLKCAVTLQTFSPVFKINPSPLPASSFNSARSFVHSPWSPLTSSSGISCLNYQQPHQPPSHSLPYKGSCPCNKCYSCT